MPEVYVYAVEGRTLDQKRGLLQDITAAVVKNFGVPAESVVVQVVEAPKTAAADSEWPRMPRWRDATPEQQAMPVPVLFSLLAGRF